MRALHPSIADSGIPNLKVFELILDGNELWVRVTFDNQETEKIFVQKFHEGADPAGSHLYQFVKELLKNPEAGIVFSIGNDTF